MAAYERIAVVACGRSGTRFASVVMSQLGLGGGHQSKIADHHSRAFNQEDNWKGESSAFFAPFVRQAPPEVLLVHQVRHPLKVAESLVRLRHVPSLGLGGGHGFYRKWAPAVTKYKHVQDEALALWLEWNKLILCAENMPNYRFHRLEEGLHPWQGYCRELGVDYGKHYASLLQIGNKVGSSGNPNPFTINQFKDQALVEAATKLAEKFGYDMEDTEKFDG